MLNKINETKETDIRNVLLKLFALYGLYTIEKDLGVLYQGGYMEGTKPPTIIQETILILLKDLKNDAIALVDGIAPEDYLMNSVLGMSDGEVH